MKRETCYLAAPCKIAHVCGQEWTARRRWAKYSAKFRRVDRRYSARETFSYRLFDGSFVKGDLGALWVFVCVCVCVSVCA